MNEQVREKRMPAHVVKLGRIQASVWANETKHGKRFNVTASRLYLSDGDWKRTDSFGRDELLTVAKAFEDAYDWIWAQGKDSESEHEEATCQLGE